MVGGRANHGPKYASIANVEDRLALRISNACPAFFTSELIGRDGGIVGSRSRIAEEAFDASSHDITYSHGMKNFRFRGVGAGAGAGGGGRWPA